MSDKLKKAPRYVMQSRGDKKPMPMPHNRRLKTPEAFSKEMAKGCKEKKAFGPGAWIGALGGTVKSPGHRMEGLGRGLTQGIGWDVGGFGGAGLGMGAGIAAAASPHVPLEAKLPASILLPLLGYFGGGELGRRTVKGLSGKPTWEKDTTPGDEDADAAQLAKA